MRRMIQLSIILLSFSCTNRKDKISEEIDLYKDSILIITGKKDSLRLIIDMLMDSNLNQSTRSANSIKISPADSTKQMAILKIEKYKFLKKLSMELESKLDVYQNHIDSLKRELKKY
jgi:hypothetical protein